MKKIIMFAALAISASQAQCMIVEKVIDNENKIKKSEADLIAFTKEFHEKSALIISGNSRR